MASRKPLVIVSGLFSELPAGDSLSTVELAAAPSGIIYVGAKLGIDGSAQISGNAGISAAVTAQASGNAALVVGTTALASGNAAQSTANTALASGNAGISTGLTALASGNAGISSAILKLPLSGGTLTGDLTLNAQSDLRFADGDSSNYIAIQAPSTVSSNLTLTLPASDGTNGQVLSTNGTGTLSWATAGGLSAATQVEMEAATSNTVAATPLQTNFHPGVAKAWLKCDQFGNISVSHNITSITDTGTGVVTVTLATDFSTNNYIVVATVAPQALIIGVSITDSGVFATDCRNSGGSTSDSSTYFFTCFGDQA